MTLSYKVSIYNFASRLSFFYQLNSRAFFAIFPNFSLNSDVVRHVEWLGYIFPTTSYHGTGIRTRVTSVSIVAPDWDALPNELHCRGKTTELRRMVKL